MFRSLRLKLTLWHVAVFTGLQIALIGGLILLRGRTFADPAIEEEMRAAGMVIIDNLVVFDEQELTGDNLNRLVPADSPFEVLSIRDEDGRVRASWHTNAGELFPFTLREKVPTGPRMVVYSKMNSAAGADLLGHPSELTVMTMPFRLAGEDLYLQAGITPSALRGIRSRFFDLAFVVLPLGMLASFLAAWLIAGRAVGPIRKLSSAARQVATIGSRLFVPTHDREVRALQSELNETLERLEENVRAQERFVSNLSHEVKTPIAVLLTEAQILKLGEPSRAQLLEFVRMVEVEMKHLGQLTETLLQLMRAEHDRGFLHGEVFSVEEVLLDATEHVGSLARAGNVRLELDVPPTLEEPEVHGDPRLVRTALENLLRNAITHSPPGSTVRIRSCEEDGSVRTDIVDQGPGIPEASIGRVFERFFRVPESTGGTGLGLALARTIVDLHQGRIAACNNPDGGCTFSILLPVARARSFGQPAVKSLG